MNVLKKIASAVAAVAVLVGFLFQSALRTAL